MEHIIENSNYQKFKETIDDYITSNLNKDKPITMVCRQELDNTISYAIGSGNYKETIELLEKTINDLKEYDNMESEWR